MVCDRCNAANSVLRDMWTPDGWKLAICAECRKDIDRGGSFRLNKRFVPLSRMAKQLRRLDNEVAEVAEVRIDYTSKAIVDSPFPASWAKK